MKINSLENKVKEIEDRLDDFDVLTDTVTIHMDAQIEAMREEMQNLSILKENLLQVLGKLKGNVKGVQTHIDRMLDDDE